MVRTALRISLVVVLAAAGFFVASFSADAGKKPCPGNSCHTTSTTATTTTADTTTGTTTTVPPPATGASFGISEPVDVLFGAGQSAMLTDYVALGIRWVRTDFAWHYIQPTDGAHFQGFTGYGAANYDGLVNAIVAHGLEPLALLTYTPAWANGCVGGWTNHCPARPPTDIGVAGSPSFNAFASATVARYKDRVHVWEIWNEPNGGYFWLAPDKTPEQQAADYARLEAGAYNAIKAADPGAIVLGGSLVPPTSTTTMQAVPYLQAMYANGARMDGVSAHPYSWNALCPSRDSTSAWWKMSSSSPSLRSVMEANGDAADKIWITEFGLSTQQYTEAAIQQCIQLDDAAWKSYAWSAGFMWFSDHENGEGFALSDASFPPVHKPRWQTYHDAIR